MADSENMKDRGRRINPRAQIVTDTLYQVMREMGCSFVVVELTDDMTAEEEEMAAFAGYLKEGYTPEEASRKAKEGLRLFRSIFEDQAESSSE